MQWSNAQSDGNLFLLENDLLNVSKVFSEAGAARVSKRELLAEVGFLNSRIGGQVF
jgi:hypothetical protein